jgi:hypothetical protein
MDIINEMKKTRSYKKHVKLLNELIQFTSKSKKNEKLILKVADLHLILAKSIKICSKGMKMEGGGFVAMLQELTGRTGNKEPTNLTNKEIHELNLKYSPGYADEIDGAHDVPVNNPGLFEKLKRFFKGNRVGDADADGGDADAGAHSEFVYDQNSRESYEQGARI